MKLRTKTPGFVSIWMLDVFCCALGCVTLLWLLKSREAALSQDETTAALVSLEENKKSLLSLQSARSSLETRLSLTEADKAQIAKELILLNTEKTELAKQLLVRKQELDEQARQIALAMAKLDDKSKELAQLMVDNKQTAQKLALSQEENEKLSRQKTMQEEANKQSSASMDNLTRQKDQALQKVRELELQVLSARNALEEADKKSRQAGMQLIDLQSNQSKLKDTLNKIQKDQESRFAGIALTGQKVIFLVDMSGSMDRLDVDTPAAKKWPTVAETLAKVMRSVVGIESYQVILFSNRILWPMGKPGEWLKFSENSPEEAKRAVLNTKPSGDTNMYNAFEAAFQMRSLGLDTIYLFSDGLPNSGPGLTPAQDRDVTKETERSNLLAKHVRQSIQYSWNRTSTTMKKVRIHSIGFFYESPDVGAFLWALSRENEGSFVGMSQP